jgi:hypothetical protein
MKLKEEARAHGGCRASEKKNNCAAHYNKICRKYKRNEIHTNPSFYERHAFCRGVHISLSRNQFVIVRRQQLKYRPIMTFCLSGAVLSP